MTMIISNALSFLHDLYVKGCFEKSKAKQMLMKSKFFISLEQSLVSSMVEFWLCAQWNWVQSPEVPSHWNFAVSKKRKVDLSQLSWGVQSCMDKCSSNSVSCSEKTRIKKKNVWLVPIKKLKICMRFPWIAFNYVSLMIHLQSSWADWDIATQKQGGRLLKLSLEQVWSNSQSVKPWKTSLKA